MVLCDHIPMPLPGAYTEFDLTLEHKGRWILNGKVLPWGLWYQRQSSALGYAAHLSRGCETMIVRLHNRMPH